MIGQSGESVDTEIVAVGMQVRVLDLNANPDLDATDVRGGVVVAIDTAYDPDTGERQRLFVTAKRLPRGTVRWAALRANEVRQIDPYSSNEIRKLIAAMAGVIAANKGRVLTDEHRKLIDAMAVLAQAS